MNKKHCFHEKTHLYNEILSYLIDNPEAQDTIDGIVKWWLLDRQIMYQTTLVKETLTELVTKGFILEQKIGLKNHYKINRLKYSEIRKFLKKKQT